MKTIFFFILVSLCSYAIASSCASYIEEVEPENGVYRCGERGLSSEGLFPDNVKEIILIDDQYPMFKVPAFRGSVKNGRLNGKAKVVNILGNVEAEMNYVNDELHGKYTGFYSSGELKLEATFVNGKQNGKATEYYQNGKIMKTLFYKNGKLEGKMKSYCKNGKLHSTQNFHNDELVGYVECANGKRGLQNMKCSCE